jgi:hypothetical protein
MLSPIAQRRTLTRSTTIGVASSAAIRPQFIPRKATLSALPSVLIGSRVVTLRLHAHFGAPEGRFSRNASGNQIVGYAQQYAT